MCLEDDGLFMATLAFFLCNIKGKVTKYLNYIRDSCVL